ncbi:MAG: hypothetical protein ACXWPM_04320, partial [Bdellovibrionota bacterium]
MIRILARATSILAVAAMLIVTATPSARANVGMDYGFGSTTESLAGAGVAWGFDGFAAYNNPAALALPKNTKRLRLSYQIVYAQPVFTPINGVVLENGYNSDKTTTETTGSVDLSVRPTFGQAIGVGYNLLPDFFNLSLGGVVYLPILQLAYIDSGPEFVPDYVLYRSRTQRPNIEVGTAAVFKDKLHVGVGAHIGFTMTSNANMFIQTANSGAKGPSSGRFAASVVPRAAPYFGVLVTPLEDKERATIGAVFRLPLANDGTLAISSGAQIFGNFAALDFGFNAATSLYYDPMAIEIGGSFKFADWGRAVAQFDYQFWSNFVPGTLFIQNPAVTNCAPNGTNPCPIQIAPGVQVPITYVNVWLPRAGGEFYVNDRVTLRV